MNRTVLPTVDAACHVSAAAEMTREPSGDTGGTVIVVPRQAGTADEPAREPEEVAAASAQAGPTA